MIKNLFLLLCCFCLYFSIDCDACFADDMSKADAQRAEIISAISAPMLEFDSFRCEYEIRFGYAATLEEGIKKGVTDLLGVYNATWRKSGKCEKLDVRRTKFAPSRTAENNTDYNLGFESCFISDGEMSMLIKYDVLQGNIASSKYVAHPEINLPLLPTSYVYLQDISLYLTDNFLAEKAKFCGIKKFNIDIKQENNLTLIQIEGEPKSDITSYSFVLNKEYSHLPHKLIRGRGLSADYVMIPEYFKFDNGKFFPKKVLDIQPYYNLDDGQLRRDRVMVREFNVIFFEPDAKLTLTDFDVILPDDVALFDGEGVSTSDILVKKNATIGIADLRTLHQKIIENETTHDNLITPKYDVLSWRLICFLIGLASLIIGLLLIRAKRKFSGSSASDKYSDK
jgi:hypothetical protein